MLNITSRIYESIENEKQRSAWDKGVTLYALELVEQLDEAISGGYFDAEDIVAPAMLEKALLNGASDWSQYSWGGSALIYNGDIAERLCNPSDPYLMYGDADAVKTNCKWYIDRIPEARPLIMAGSMKCRQTAGGGWAVAPHFDGAHKTRHFSTLGRALAYLKREEARAI